jgi:hypothetical protein
MGGALTLKGAVFKGSHQSARALGRGRFSRLACQRLTDLEAGEAADDDVFAQLSDLRVEQIIDRLGVVLDESLLEQADRAVILVDLARDDLLDHGGGFALDRGAGHIALDGEQLSGTSSRLT